MRKLVFVAAAVVGFAVTAHAASDPLAGFYGNTVILSSPGKPDRTLLINSDGTYAIADTGGKTVRGTWAAAEGKTCFTQTTPAADAKPYCTPDDPHKVGDTWNMAGPDGGPVTLTLKAGR